MRIPGAEGFGNAVPLAPYQMKEPGGPRVSPLAVLGGVVTDLANKEAQEQKRLRDAADEATARGKMVEGRDALAAASQEYATDIAEGRVPKDGALQEWQARASKITAEHMAGVPKAMQQIVAQDFSHRTSIHGREVVRAVGQRDVSDTRAGIDKVRDSALRTYSSDPQGADSMFESTIASLGGAARFSPQELEKYKTNYYETSRENKAVELINLAKRDNKALDEVEKRIGTDEFKALDQRKLVNMYNAIANYKYNNDREKEANERRAMALADHRMKVAESSFNAAEKMSLSGMLSPEQINRVRIDTQGTPWAMTFESLLKNQQVTGSFAGRPIAEQVEVVSELRRDIAANGISQEKLDRLKAYEGVQKASVNAADDDIVEGYTARNPSEKYQPINFASGNVQRIAEQLAARRELAGVSSMWAGRPSSGLKNAEAQEFASFINKLPAEQASQAAQVFATALGPQAAQGLAVQVGKQGGHLQHVFAYQGAKSNMGNDVSTLIMQGYRSRVDGTNVYSKDRVPPEVRHKEIQANIASYIGGAYANEEQKAKVIDAARYIADAFAARNNGQLSDDEVKAAASLAMGGHIVEHAKFKTLLPMGRTSGDVEDQMKAVTLDSLKSQSPEGFVYAGGAKVDLERFKAGLPGRQLVYRSKNSYYVYERGRPVLSSELKPIVVEVR